jgi:Mg-chelatase subunit ChlD
MSGDGRRQPVAMRRAAAGARASIATLAALLIAAMAVAIVVTPARAQESVAVLEIVSVEHAPSGLIEAAVNTASAELDLEGATAVLDGLPVEVRSLAVERREPASIVIAIDTSGSMSGAPILAAKEAARLLVDRLDAADRVAIVAFATQPIVASEFTINRASTRSTLGILGAGGDTALYDAVTRSVELLEAVSAEAPRVLVLLSDGRDAAGSADPRRDINVAHVEASGVEVHAFGLGTDVDEEYLRALSAANDGSYSGVATEQALAPLFEALGTRLGASHRVAVDVPPLALGEHTFALRTRTGAGASAFVFTVDNAGLLALSEEPQADADRIVVGVASPVEAARLNLSAHVDGEPVPIVDGRVLLDPWAYAPGTHAVEIESQAGGGLAARAALTVQVPALPAELATRIDTSTRPATLIVEARGQGPGPYTIVASAAGEELTRGEGR